MIFFACKIFLRVYIYIYSQVIAYVITLYYSFLQGVLAKLGTYSLGLDKSRVKTKG